MAVRDTPAALLRHVSAVLTTRAHPERDQRVDLTLGDDLANRLGPDRVARFEAMVGIALAALDMIGARRERDRLVALGRPDRAQPYGGRLCVAEKTIHDLVKVLVAPAAPHDTTGTTGGQGAGSLRDQADARARALAATYAAALATGCNTDTAVARFLNERRIPACGPGPWTEPRAAALRRRLTKLGLARLVLSLPKVAVRQVRTRTRTPPHDIHTPGDDTDPALDGQTSYGEAGRGFGASATPAG